jgi:hypothetical protein
MLQAPTRLQHLRSPSRQLLRLHPSRAAPAPARCAASAPPFRPAWRRLQLPDAQQAWQLSDSVVKGAAAGTAQPRPGVPGVPRTAPPAVRQPQRWSSAALPCCHWTSVCWAQQPAWQMPPASGRAAVPLPPLWPTSRPAGQPASSQPAIFRKPPSHAAGAGSKQRHVW